MQDLHNIHDTVPMFCTSGSCLFSNNVIIVINGCQLASTHHTCIAEVLLLGHTLQVFVIVFFDKKLTV